MKDKTQLKPCPFCGGQARLNGSYYFDVECTECGIRTAPSSSDAEVIKLWNTRTKEE